MVGGELERLKDQGAADTDRPGRLASFNQMQHWSTCLHLKTIPVKTDFRAILKRFDATLQLSSSLWIRSNSRTHG